MNITYYFQLFVRHPSNIMKNTFDTILNVVDTNVDKPVRKRVIFITCLIFIFIMLGMNCIEIILSTFNYDSIKCFLNSKKNISNS